MNAHESVDSIDERPMKKRPAGKGFVFGLLSGLVFVGYKLFKYSGGGRRDDLPIYVLTILTFGIIGWALGAIGGRAVDLIRRR